MCVEILQDGTTPYPQMKSNPEVMAFVNNAKVHPQPAGCTDQVYSELRRCFSFAPEARPSFAELNEFFMALVATDSSARSNMPSGGPKSAEDQNQHFLSLLHGHTAGNPTVFEELREDGDITTDDTYNTSEYMQLGDKRKASIDTRKSYRWRARWAADFHQTSPGCRGARPRGVEIPRAI